MVISFHSSCNSTVGRHISLWTYLLWFQILFLDNRNYSYNCRLIAQNSSFMSYLSRVLILLISRPRIDRNYIARITLCSAKETWFLLWARRTTLVNDWKSSLHKWETKTFPTILLWSRQLYHVHELHFTFAYIVILFFSLLFFSFHLYEWFDNFLINDEFQIKRQPKFKMCI